MTTVHGTSAASITVTRMDRAVATINRIMYPAWGGAAIYRETSLALALAALFRQGSVPAATVAMINLGVLASTVCAVTEMAVTAAVFCRTVIRHADNRTDLIDCGAAHARFVQAMEAARMHAKRELPVCGDAVDGAEYEYRTQVALPDDAMDAPLLDDAACAAPPHETEGIAVQVEHYAAHRAARAAEPARQRQLRDDGLAFGRDTLVQGGVAGSNLALLWHAFDVGGLLHVGADVVSVAAASVASSVCSLAMGVFHVVAAALSWRSATRLRALARNARDMVGALRGGLGRAFDRHGARSAGSAADYERAAPVCAALLEHAGRNETAALQSARQQIFASKCRMAFGVTSLILGSVSLVLLLVLGAVSTGGLMIGMAAVLAGLAWLTNATVRSHRHAVSLELAAREMGSPRLPSLDETIAEAVDLLDDRSGSGGAYPAARKVIKHMLLDMGMSRSDFRPLKWAPGAVREQVRAELADTIRRHAAGDAMRRALEGVSPKSWPVAQAR